MPKDIQSGIVSDPLSRALALVGKFGPALDEVVSPIVVSLNVGELPYAARGKFMVGRRVAPVAAQFPFFAFRNSDETGSSLVIIDELRFHPNTSGTAWSLVIVNALDTGTAVEAYYSDWRRFAFNPAGATPRAVQNLSVTSGNVAAFADPGVILAAGETAPGQQVVIPGPWVLASRPGAGGDALRFQYALGTGFSMLASGEQYNLRTPHGATV